MGQDHHKLSIRHSTPINLLSLTLDRTYIHMNMIPRHKNSLTVDYVLYESVTMIFTMVLTVIFVACDTHLLQWLESGESWRAGLMASYIVMTMNIRPYHFNCCCNWYKYILERKYMYCMGSRWISRRSLSNRFFILLIQVIIDILPPLPCTNYKYLFSVCLYLQISRTKFCEAAILLPQ